MLIDETNVLTPSKAFVSLALLNLLRMPMSMLPNVINQVVQTWVSVNRINAFLNAEDLEPYVTHHESNGTIFSDFLKQKYLSKAFSELIDLFSVGPISVENGTFTWGEEPTLRNINLKVPKNSLTAVVGAVGAGKSSIISALLGEMDKVSGSVNSWGSIAYVPQQAWIQNATVKDNITFGKPFDKIK